MPRSLPPVTPGEVVRGPLRALWARYRLVPAPDPGSEPAAPPPVPRTMSRLTPGGGPSGDGGDGAHGRGTMAPAATSGAPAPPPSSPAPAFTAATVAALDASLLAFLSEPLDAPAVAERRALLHARLGLDADQLAARAAHPDRSAADRAPDGSGTRLAPLPRNP